MASNDWHDAAEALGLTVAPLGTHRRPTELLGTIGAMDVRVLLRQQGTQATGRYTACSVAFPHGPWDDHTVTVKGGTRLSKILRRRSMETGDPVFDRRFVVKLGLDPAASAWVATFLTDDRRAALLDLRERRPSVRMVTGRRLTDDRYSGLVDTLGGRADDTAIVESVRAMVVCAGVLTTDS